MEMISEMKIKNKSTTALCNLETYTLFLLSEPKLVSWVRLSNILENLSHDSVNRFLTRSKFSSKDLFDTVKQLIVLENGILTVDDMVMDKPYSDNLKSELIAYFWSGKHHKVVKGINVITLYYTDIRGVSVPVNYRIVNKNDGKSKHEYLLEMLAELEEWGLKPLMITGDCWYGKKETLSFFKDKEQGFLFALKTNRLIAVEQGKFVQIKDVQIPQSGLIVTLKDVGLVKVFTTLFKDEVRYYAIFLPTVDELKNLSRETFLSIHNKHWGIEEYHRALKQVCNIERFYVRKTEAVATHIFCSIRAFIQLELLRFNQEVVNWYALKRNMFNEVIRSFIINNLEQDFLNINNLIQDNN